MFQQQRKTWWKWPLNRKEKNFVQFQFTLYALHHHLHHRHSDQLIVLLSPFVISSQFTLCVCLPWHLFSSVDKRLLKGVHVCVCGTILFTFIFSSSKWSFSLAPNWQLVSLCRPFEIFVHTSSKVCCCPSYDRHFSYYSELDCDHYYGRLAQNL